MQVHHSALLAWLALAVYPVGAQTGVGPSGSPKFKNPSEFTSQGIPTGKTKTEKVGSTKFPGDKSVKVFPDDPPTTAPVAPPKPTIDATRARIATEDEKCETIAQIASANCTDRKKRP